MNSEIINICSNRNLKRWLIVRDDGTLTLRTEVRVFDLLAAHREVTDQPITTEELARLSPVLAAEAAAVLQRLVARAADGEAA
jgi:hypothetical protein